MTSARLVNGVVICRRICLLLLYGRPKSQMVVWKLDKRGRGDARTNSIRTFSTIISETILFSAENISSWTRNPGVNEHANQLSHAPPVLNSLFLYANQIWQRYSYLARSREVNPFWHSIAGTRTRTASREEQPLLSVRTTAWFGCGDHMKCTFTLTRHERLEIEHTVYKHV